MRFEPFNPALSRGRQFPQKDEEDPFIVDNNRIMLSPPFIRLYQVRQVFRHDFCAYEATRPYMGRPVISTRGAHIGVVSQTADRLAQLLGLNGNYCAAAARAHDIGHPHKGHLAEYWLRELFAGFSHKRFGLLLAQEILGLNLSYETLMAIACNVKDGALDGESISHEHAVVALADKMSYVFVDAHEVIDDLTYPGQNRLGLSVKESRDYVETVWQLLEPFTVTTGRYLGTLGVPSFWSWLHACESAVANESLVMGRIQFRASSEAQSFWRLKQWLDDNIYRHADQPEDLKECVDVLTWLCDASAYKQYDPFVLFCLMTDIEVRLMAEGLRKGLPENEWEEGPWDTLMAYHEQLPEPGQIRLDLPYSFAWAGENRFV